jgi:hypothetical protein
MYSDQGAVTHFAESTGRDDSAALGQHLWPNKGAQYTWGSECSALG